MILTTLQSLLALIGLVLFLQGKGAHGVVVAIVGVVPALRFLVSKEYRMNVRLRYSEHLRRLSEYPRGPAPVLSSFIVVGIPLLVLSLVNGISLSSYDNYGTLMTAASIVNDGDLEISEFNPKASHNPYFFREGATGIRSAYPIGMVFPLTAIYGVSRIVGGDILNATTQWRLSKGMAAAITALCLTLFLLIAKRFQPLNVALFATAFLGLGSAFLTTLSQGAWSHDGVVLGFLGALWIQLDPNLNKRPGALLLTGFLLSWMFACRLSAALIIAPLLLWIFLERGWKTVFLVGVCALLFHLPLNFYYWQNYSNAFGPQMTMGTSRWEGVDLFPQLAGLFFSPGRGFFIYQPWSLLLVLLVIPEVRQKGLPSPLTALFVAIIVFHSLIIGLWPDWAGGTSWGSRLLVEIIAPVALLILAPIAYVISRFENGTKFLVGVCVVSFLFHLPALFLFAGFWDGDLWSWTRPPFLYPFQKP